MAWQPAPPRRQRPGASRGGRGFSSGAETYVRGRPDYPPEALEWLRNAIGLGAGKTVVDLGAGTGKFHEGAADDGREGGRRSSR